MSLSTWSKLGAVTLVVLAIGYVAYRQLYISPAEDFKPDLKSDLNGKVVAVPSPEKPGELVAWRFDSTDNLEVNQLDVHVEGRKRIVYAEIKTITKDHASLAGIIEAHYVQVKSKHYLVALGSLTLILELPVSIDPIDPKKPNKEPKKEKPKAKKEEPTKSEDGTAQSFPTDK